MSCYYALHGRSLTLDQGEGTANFASSGVTALSCARCGRRFCANDRWFRANGRRFRRNGRTFSVADWTFHRGDWQFTSKGRQFAAGGRRSRPSESGFACQVCQYARKVC